MTPEQIAADIERGIVLRKEIAEREAELKEIEARLKTAAEKGEHVPLQDKDREGKQCLLRSPRSVLPIRFTADSIIASFLKDSPAHTEILAIVGEAKLPLFFKEVPGFARVPKDGQAFRKIARENLEPDAFAKLIHAATARDKKGIAKSTVQIAWDDAKPPEAVPST
jgi:hypothetical protein